MNVVVLPSAGRQKWWGTNTAVSSEAWAKLREWAILAGKGRLLLSGSVVLASLIAAVDLTISGNRLGLSLSHSKLLHFSRWTSLY